MSAGGAVMKRLAAARRSRHIPQNELARALGTSPSYLSKIERGRVNCSVDTLFRYATAAGVSPLLLAAFIVDALQDEPA